MRPSGRAYSLAVATWVIIFASYAFLKWTGVFLTIPIFTLIMFSTLFFKPNLDVEVRRIVSQERVIEGGEAEIEIIVKSKERIRSLYIEDLTPPSLEVIGKNSWVISLEEEDEKKLRYKVKVRRGIHEFPGIRIVYRDPLGIFEEDRIIEAYDEVVGVPRLEDIVTPYSTKGTKITTGPLPSPRIGEGLEFHAVREYHPGDPIKIMNWKATAKVGKLMVNEFESERKVDVVLVIDATYKAGEVFDHMMRAAASLLFDSLKNGTSFGLLISESVPLWMKVDYGKRHFFKCIDVLSMASPDKNNLIAYQVEHLARTKIPPRAQIIFISPFMTKESEDALITMYRFGYRIVAISPDPYSLIKPKTREEELAVRLLSLKRKARIRKLRSYAPIIDWNVNVPLKSAVLEVVKW